MKTIEYKKMAELENSYWWHVGRKRIINQQLKSLKLKKTTSILNIGCGTGGMIPLFEQYGTVTNIDVSIEAVKYCKDLGYKDTIKFNGKRLPFSAGVFDVIVATDVLEHIENDSKALKEWYRVLKPGGKLIITVPAYQWLWSEHDESLHHFRRYTASGLHNLVNNNKFTVLKRSYIIVFSFPLIVLYRLIASISKKPGEKQTSYVILPSIINKFFIYLLAFEGRLLKYINFPYGTSVLIEARK